MDRFRDTLSVPVLKERVGHLLSLLTTLLNARGYQTQEELSRAYLDVAERALRSYDELTFDPGSFHVGTLPELSAVNLFLTSIYNEFVYLKRAAHSSAEVIQSNFNLATRSVRKLQADLKYCNQLLATYSLYASKYGNAMYLADTFDTQERIEAGSSFLGKTECFVDTSEGTVSLPHKKEHPRTIEKIDIGNLSNGRLGNNLEAEAPVRGDLRAAYDGDVDTWFEYERISDREDIRGLYLELKIALSEVAPVNNIKIIPVRLGARTSPTIQEILVSEDGRNWISLRDEVNVAEFLGEKREDQFKLSPAGSRFAGIFNITFAPRLVKFLKIGIWQGSAFPIMDTYKTTWLRSAIGIKEISVSGVEYHPAGELVSRLLTFGRPVSGVAVQSLVDPPFVPPEVGSVGYYLSWDDGASWSQIASMDESRLDIPEILYPEGATTSFRWKIALSRDAQAFKSSVTQRIEQAREARHWPTILPAEIRLQHKPIKGTVTVLDPNVTIRGRAYPRLFIGNGAYSRVEEVQDAPGTFYRHDNTQLVLQIPFAIKDPSTLRLYVNGVLWSRAATTSAMATLESRVYILRSTEDGEFLEVVFGNNEGGTGGGTAPGGKIPQPSDKISISLLAEEVCLEGITDPFEINLDYPSDGEKGHTELFFIGDSGDVRNHRIASDRKLFKMPHKSLTSVEIVVRTVTPPAPPPGEGGGGMAPPEGGGILLGVCDTAGGQAGQTAPFIVYKEFVDGESELINPGDWTVDLNNGTLYSRDLTFDNRNYSVNYSHRKILKLDSGDWDFVQGSTQKIAVKRSGYYTLNGSVSVGASVKSVTLGKRAIIAKSVRLSPTVTHPYRAFEVPFIDGVKEFEAAGTVQNEAVPAISAAEVSPGHWVVSFRPTHASNLVVDDGIRLNGTTFLPTLQVTFVDGASEFANNGEWSVDLYGDRRVYLHMISSFVSSDLVSEISYSYADPHLDVTMRGSYSVDVRNGTVHFGRSTMDAGIIRFQHAPYEAIYRVARVLQEKVDFLIGGHDGRTLTLEASSESDVAKKLAIRYFYNPPEASTADLGVFYSPLVRALAIRGI